MTYRLKVYYLVENKLTWVQGSDGQTIFANKRIKAKNHSIGFITNPFVRHLIEFMLTIDSTINTIQEYSWFEKRKWYKL